MKRSKKPKKTLAYELMLLCDGAYIIYIRNDICDLTVEDRVKSVNEESILSSSIENDEVTNLVGLVQHNDVVNKELGTSSTQASLHEINALLGSL